MASDSHLERFIPVHQQYFANALQEIRKGKKTSHWMWYIFPQLEGLGFSENSRHYGIKNLDEAKSFLQHPILGQNLVQITSQLLSLPVSDALQVFGSPDHMKLQSSMTLFSAIPGTPGLFDSVLDKFFNGKKDAKTLTLLNK